MCLLLIFMYDYADVVIFVLVVVGSVQILPSLGGNFTPRGGKLGQVCDPDLLFRNIISAIFRIGRYICRFQ